MRSRSFRRRSARLSWRRNLRSRMTVSCLPLHYADKRFNVPHRVGPGAVSPWGILYHVWHVIRQQKPGEPDLLQGLEHLQDVAVALIDKAFLETRHDALHTAQ